MGKSNQVYYIYKYTLGDLQVEVCKLDIYENEMLNTVNAWVDNKGVYHFYMYSNRKDKTKEFLQWIDRLIEADCSAASRLAQMATGRLLQFRDCLSSIKEGKRTGDNEK